MGIEVKSLSFSYGSRSVLRQISFSVRDGEFLSILGPNGVGKSTLLRCLLGLQKGYGGTVLLDGEDVSALAPRALARQAAYIPQNCSPAFPFRVEDVVLMGTTHRLGAFGSPGKKERAQAHRALEKLGIAHLSDRSFLHLSGGERQLVIIARALAQDARILLLDEPTASLDYGNQIQVLSQAKALSREGYTILQTTHDPQTAFQFSDRILALRDGAVLACGTPKEVLTSQNMRGLYGIALTVTSLYDDRVRVCVPDLVLRSDL